MKTRLLVLLVSILLLTGSCSFNPLFYFPDKDKEAPASKGEDVYIPFRGDKEVHGIFYPQKFPIASVFILHGNAGSLAGWKSVAEALHEEGYQAFIFDYPGFGVSDGRPRHNQVIEAAQAAFDYFVQRQEVQNTRKIMLGFSLGGNLALKTGPDNQDQLDALVVEGCFNNYEEIGMDRTPKMFRWFTWLALGAKFRGEETIKSWNKPFLVIHSKEDEACPYWMGEQVYENCPSEKKELWTIEGPHIRGFALYGEEYYNKLRKLAGTY